MSEAKQYIQTLFAQKKIAIAPKRIALFEEYVKDEANVQAVQFIQETQKKIMDKWELKNKINDIVDKQLMIPNATVGKPYEAALDFLKSGMNDIVFTEFESLEAYGLVYDNKTEIIKGTPVKSGDFKIKMKFRVNGEPDDSVLNEKMFSLIINSDPKSLWKNIQSDEGKDEEWKTKNYWKPDDAVAFNPLGDKHIVVASKRGRSHANVGSFRDDDFSYTYFAETGWSLVCVADGAGSAKLSRQGSKIACEGIMEYFGEHFKGEALAEFDKLIAAYSANDSNTQPTATADAINTVSFNVADENPATTNANLQDTAPLIADEVEATADAVTNSPDAVPITIDAAPATTETSPKNLNVFLYNYLGKAAFYVHKKLQDFANKLENPIKDLHTTLIFALFKKYEFGYAILTFGVGDCPIGLLNKEMTEIKLMNWLDVGEFGGGTRFITMPEIFSSNKFPTRFGFKVIKDFSYLMLMTDGIYDPKFVVEANLEKIEQWQAFVADLGGDNEEKIKVDFNPQNEDIANQLSAWMDFWSTGNHDDRTLAIVF